LQSHISADSNDFDAWKTHFEVPHWMHLSFAAYDNTEDVKKEDVNSDGKFIKHPSSSPVSPHAIKILLQISDY
jgi:hypothetical protein